MKVKHNKQSYIVFCASLLCIINNLFSGVNYLNYANYAEATEFIEISLFMFR